MFAESQPVAVDSDPIMSKISHSYRLSRDAFGHWIVVNDERPLLGWTGSGWAPIHDNGLPAGDYQISNFASIYDALMHATECGLTLPSSRRPRG